MVRLFNSVTFEKFFVFIVQYALCDILRECIRHQFFSLQRLCTVHTWHQSYAKENTFAIPLCIYWKLKLFVIRMVSIWRQMIYACGDFLYGIWDAVEPCSKVNVCMVVEVTHTLSRWGVLVHLTVRWISVRTDADLCNDIVIEDNFNHGFIWEQQSGYLDQDLKFFRNIFLYFKSQQGKKKLQFFFKAFVYYQVKKKIEKNPSELIERNT